MDHASVAKTNFTVPQEFDGARLDVFIFQMCDLLPSRSYSAKLIKNGLVLVNKKVRKPSWPIKVNDTIEVNLEFLNQKNEIPQAEDIPLQILFEDEHILVINKPSGLVVHPGAGISSGTLVNALLSHCGTGIPSLDGKARAGIVHRLDRDTAGVMVTAKTQYALTALSKQFADHSHTRIYHAICYGEFKKSQDSIETGHIRDPGNRLKYKSAPLGEGKRAALSYRVLKTLSDNIFSLVECTLETGRTHQIRVQMKHINHEVVGDALYSRISDKCLNNKPLAGKVRKTLTRQMLHASVLEITHPVTQERMRFTAPYPQDFEDFLNAVSN